MNTKIKTTLFVVVLLHASLACYAAWYLSYSNSQDGWIPVVAIEINDDGSTNRTVPLAYQPFNTNHEPTNVTIRWTTISDAEAFGPPLVSKAVPTNITSSVWFTKVSIGPDAPVTNIIDYFATNAFFQTNTTFGTKKFVVEFSGGTSVGFACRDQDQVKIFNSIVASGDYFHVPTNIVFRNNEFTVFMSNDSSWTCFMRDQDRTNIINALATSGEFCRVRGHLFEMHEHNQFLTADGLCRQCEVCGKHETKTEEWK